MFVPPISLGCLTSLRLAAKTSTNMKTMERQNMTARGQMELPLGNALGGKIASRRRSRNHGRAPQHVADWWFARMRMWTMDTEAKPEGRVVA